MNKNNDSKIAVEDIKKIHDANELESIALTHPDNEVCIEAVKKIRSQKSLNRVALNSNKWQVRQYAAIYIENPNILTKILNTDPYNNVKLEAIRNPNFSRSLLFELAGTDGDYGNYALNVIYDRFIERYAQEKYSKYKIYCDNQELINIYYIHDKAFSEIEEIHLLHNKEILGLIENNAPYEEIINKNNDYGLLERCARYDKNDAYYYLRHIKDETILIDLLQDPYWSMNDYALSSLISDESIILDTFTQPRHDFSLMSAAQYFHDNSALEYLAFQKADKKTRMSHIVSKIYDQDILMNIALNHPAEEAQVYAVLNMDKSHASDYLSLNNSDAIKEKIMRERNYKGILNEISKIRSLAHKIALVKCITDEGILEKICLSDNDIEIQRACVRNIKDTGRLLRIIKRTNSGEVSQDAVYNIDDEYILRDLAMNNNKRWARDESIKKIADEEFLADIAKNHEYRFVRETAIMNPHLVSKTLLDILETEEDEYVQIKILEKICKLGD